MAIKTKREITEKKILSEVVMLINKCSTGLSFIQLRTPQVRKRAMDYSTAQSTSPAMP